MTAWHSGHSFAGASPLPRARWLDPELIDRTVPQHVAGEVEHEAVGLARMQTEAASYHLVIEPGRERRSQQHDAVDVGRIEASREHVDVAQVLQWLAREEATIELAAKASQKFVALARGRVATDEAALDAVVLGKDAHDVPAMLDAGREYQDRLPIGGVADDLAAGRLDQAVLVHEVLDLVGDVLAFAHVQPTGVGLGDTVFRD